MFAVDECIVSKLYADPMLSRMGSWAGVAVIVTRRKPLGSCLRRNDGKEFTVAQEFERNRSLPLQKSHRSLLTVAPAKAGAQWRSC